ncbi:hypothetical protein ACVIM5_000662 [Bradyrhizobium sp. USDA 4512]
MDFIDRQFTGDPGDGIDNPDETRWSAAAKNDKLSVLQARDSRKWHTGYPADGGLAHQSGLQTGKLGRPDHVARFGAAM